MKDSRNSPFIKDLSKGLMVTGSFVPSAASYTRFNHFVNSESEVGTYISDFSDSLSPYRMSIGDRGGNTGNFTATTGSLSQLNIYGQKVYTDELIRGSAGVRTIMSQRGLDLPVVPQAADAVFVTKDISSLYSSSPNEEITVMLKVKLTSTANSDNSVISFASGGDPATDAFSINVTGNEISSLCSGGSSNQSSTAVSIAEYDFVTVFASFYNDSSGNSVISKFSVYETLSGQEISFQDMGNSCGTAIELASPILYIGYGRGSGSVNNNFDEGDFVDILLAEIAIFNLDLTRQQMQVVARSHLAKNQYKSGFNNRPVRRVNQLLDARTEYPASSNPLTPKTPTSAFNDQFTKIYGKMTASGSISDIMYPEMLPAYMFSGSDSYRGAEGDTRSFYRDLHHTEYDKRITAPGVMRQGLSHKETELFNIAKRSSPVVIGEESSILGGTAAAFNDNDPLIDKNRQRTADELRVPGFDQKLSDQVAIVIELNPVESTTIGVERSGGSNSWLGTPTGRVTSMAYFNFSTRKWETAGKNNDFQIPGAMTFSTGSSLGYHESSTLKDRLPAKLEHIKQQFGSKLIESSSLGFSGTSGFTIMEDAGPNAFSSLQSRARPTSIAGFPVHSKYEAKDGQLIDMSKYIDAPFVLERVEFEVDMAVEDSGPHSLGYRMSAPSNSESSTEPYIKFYPDVDTETDGVSKSFYDSIDYAKVLDNQKVYLPRATFINGSQVADANDFSSNRKEKNTITPAAGTGTLQGMGTTLDTLPIGNRPSYSGAGSKALASILLGYQNHHRTEIPKSGNDGLSNYPWANPGFRFVEGAGSIWGREYRSLGEAQYRLLDENSFPARVMLPVVPGPRLTGPARSITNEGWCIAPMSPRRHLTPSTKFFSSVTVSYVPVLAGGVNGIVTGSNDPVDPNYNLSFIDPHAKPVAYVEKRNYGVEGRKWSSIGNTNNPEWALFDEPGVPFWRADTFFLLRQTKSSRKRSLNFSFKVSESSSKVFFPLTPWANIVQPQMQSGRNDELLDGQGPDTTALSTKNWTIGQHMQGMYGIRTPAEDNPSVDGFIYGRSLPAPPTPSPGFVSNAWYNDNGTLQFRDDMSRAIRNDRISLTTSADTSRDLITYGQVVHYGYCAAQDGYVDTIMDSSPSWASGSIDTDYETAILNREVSLFGQAMKLSRCQSAATSVIPSNPHSIKDSTQSAFSDAPDSFQGMWSFEVGERSEGQNSLELGANTNSAKKWIPSFTVLDGTAPGGYINFGSRDRAGRCTSLKSNAVNNSSPTVKQLPLARYASEEYYDPTHSGAGRSEEAESKHLVHTLDNWQITPLLYYDDYTSIAGSSSGSYEWSLTSAVNQYQTADITLNPRSVDTTQYLAPDLVPGGSGFSIICTPAWPIGDSLDASYYASKNSVDQNVDGNLVQFSGGPYYAFNRLQVGEMSINSRWTDASPNNWETDSSVAMRFYDYGFFGGFSFKPYARTSDSALGESPNSTWLQAGLARDYNVNILAGQKHEGTNIDFDDNWSGFTLMTASTVSRPGEASGRETATLPLHANVYKRQWLNFQRGIKFDVPVKIMSPTSGEDSGFWVATAPDVFGPQATTDGVNDSQYQKGFGYIVTPHEDNAVKTERRWKQNIDDAPWKFAMWGKRYHRRHALSIAEGGYVPGPSADSFTSGKYFFRRASSSKKLDVNFHKTRVPVLGGYGRTDTEHPEFYSSISNESFYNLTSRTLMSGSMQEDITQKSLYILDPSDKLILGVQPSLPGWNPGSGLPNNRWAKKWGTWDYEGSAAAGEARHLDYDSVTGQLIDDPMMNLEDPYEPCHGLTMLSGKSRIVLYGSFVKDGKHYSPSSKQKLQSPAVHEALHSDNPILDQFLINDSYEYAGSNLTQHVVGSMLEGNRGVSGTLEEGTLVFSGSFQRFTKSSETSQVFYDTLLHDPYEIVEADGYAVRPGNLVTATLLNMHQPHEWIAKQTADYYAREENNAFDVYSTAAWPDSFPFEEKYDNVKRLISRDLTFAKPSLGLLPPLINPDNVSIGIGAPMSVETYFSTGFPPRVHSNGVPTTSSSRHLKYLTGSNVNKPAREYWDYLSGVVSEDGVAYSIGMIISGIRNMAETLPSLEGLPRQSFNHLNLGLIKTAFPPAKESDQVKRISAYRRFAAVMTGYGRQNRKQLDLTQEEFFLDHDQVDTASIPAWYYIGGQTGYATCFHPAGFKYGYMNCDHLYPSMVHRADRYGQLRDMLEQRLYGKVYSFGDEYNKRGESESAVTCIFVDADGAPIDDATKTQCLNLSTSAASRKPFIEGEVIREIIFSSESVTIE
jgi:hypothetical protein